MRVELHPCYILHHRPYRETSLLLDVFSQKYGRISLIAKGGRKQKNHKRALMQPGRKVNIAWTIRRDMGTLTFIEPGQPHPVLTGKGLLNIFYINELLVKLLHQHEPHPELFDAYDQALNGLLEKAREQPVLRLFEKRMLASLGYGLILDSDVNGSRIMPGVNYNYLTESGPVPYEAPQNGAVKISGQTLIALSNGDLNRDTALFESRQLMRMVIKKLLGNKTLTSRELYKYHLENAR